MGMDGFHERMGVIQQIIFLLNGNKIILFHNPALQSFSSQRSQRKPCGVNRPKSVSRLTHVHPCSIAVAAWEASDTALPAVRVSRHRSATRLQCREAGCTH